MTRLKSVHCEDSFVAFVEGRETGEGINNEKIYCEDSLTHGLAGR